MTRFQENLTIILHLRKPKGKKETKKSLMTNYLMKLWGIWKRN